MFARLMQKQLPSTREIVEQYGLLKNHSHSKRLGQNFLLDELIPQKIVNTLGVIEGTNVLEIGPGPGGLTKEILKKTPFSLKAIERDEKCIDALQYLVNWAGGSFEVLQGDATKISASQIFGTEVFQIIANLPYNVSTVLLAQWMHSLGQISSITVMVQKEVARRIIAKPQNKDYGRLSVLCQWMCDISLLFDVPPHVFTPAPKVFSSVIQLKPKKNIETKKLIIPSLEKVTQAAFSKRRKMIRSSLGLLFNQADFEHHLNELKIQETQRPETLTIDQFAYFAQQL